MGEKRKRLKGTVRKQAILKAARPLFAEHGFKGTSVRTIARAANVSEALLYKHFPSKEIIYREMFGFPLKQIDITLGGLTDVKAGTEMVVLLVYVVYSLILNEMPGRASEQRTFERLLAQSLLGDADFARSIFKVYHDKFIHIFMKSLNIAIMKGDMVKVPISKENRIWFAHHLAMALQMLSMTGTPVYKCGLSKDELVNEGVIYSLRGMGMTDEAITRCFKPDNLKTYVMKLINDIFSGSAAE